MFDRQKKGCMLRLDKSKKGSVDDAILELVETLNKSKDYYTTSSCAGRIVLVKLSANGKKNETSWYYVSHDKAKFLDIRKALYSAAGSVWFKQEAFIIHVACRDLDAAHRLLKASRNAGLRRGGVISLKDKIFVEIMGSERLDVPVFEERILIDDDYLEFLVKEANKKLKKTRKKMMDFMLSINAMLS